MSPKAKTKIAFVDDHTLFRKGLISLIDITGDDYSIIFEADNGIEMKEKIQNNGEPDILFLDVNMPKMDGFACVEWLSQHYPLVKILVVSMIEQEETIVRMLRLGVKGYLCKDVEPKQLSEAINALLNKGYYYTDFVTGKLVHALQQTGNTADPNSNMLLLNDREKSFLTLACSDLTYNEIAAKMFLSPKTIDGYRDNLFEKLNVKSRVGLALYAVKHGLVTL